MLGLSANFIASGCGLTTNEWLRRVIDKGWEKLTGERLFGTDATEDGRPFAWNSAFAELGYNVSNDIPFVRNVAGLLGLGDETLPWPDVYGGIKDMAAAAKSSGVFSGEMLDAAAGLAAQAIPGGKQLEKTRQGIKTMTKGGRVYGYGDKERLQYPVEGSAGNWARAALFGNAGLSETEAFYAGERSGLTAKQTELYRKLVENGAEGETVYNTMQAMRGVEEQRDKRDILQAAALTDRQKLELFKGMFNASEKRMETFSRMLSSGLRWNKVMDTYNRYAELEDTEGMNAGRKAIEFAKWADGQGFTEAQRALVKEELSFYSVIPAKASRYEDFTAAGVSKEAAYSLARALSALEPEDGKETVSSIQRYEAVVQSGLEEKEQAAALSALMSEGEGLKLRITRVYYLTPEKYVEAKKQIAAADDNGSITQEESKQVIDQIPGLYMTQRAALWQIQNKSWKAGNNPYSTNVGTQVKEALELETERFIPPQLRVP